MKSWTHPHPDKQHVITAIRGHILACKRKFGTARSQVKYRELILTYLQAKKELHENNKTQVQEPTGNQAKD